MPDSAAAAMNSVILRFMGVPFCETGADSVGAPEWSASVESACAASSVLDQDVVARAAVEDVQARAAEQDVVAFAAEQGVVPGATDEDVVRPRRRPASAADELDASPAAMAMSSPASAFIVSASFGGSA